MGQFSLSDVRWGPVAIGWVVSVIAGIIIALILGALGLVSGAEQGILTAGGFVGAVIVGFLAHLVGGYVAGRQAGVAPATNGAAVAVFGLIVVIVLGIILAIIGALFLGGNVSTTPGFLGYASGGFVTVIISAVFNVLGGYLGGRFVGRGASSGGSRPSRVR